MQCEEHIRRLQTKLTALQTAVLNRLWKQRDAVARRLDVNSGLVASNATLVHLARMKTDHRVCTQQTPCIRTRSLCFCNHTAIELLCCAYAPARTSTRRKTRSSISPYKKLNQSGSDRGGATNNAFAALEASDDTEAESPVLSVSSNATVSPTDSADHALPAAPATQPQQQQQAVIHCSPLPPPLWFTSACRPRPQCTPAALKAQRIRREIESLSTLPSFATPAKSTGQATCHIRALHTLALPQRTPDTGSHVDAVTAAGDARKVIVATSAAALHFLQPQPDALKVNAPTAAAVAAREESDERNNADASSSGDKAVLHDVFIASIDHLDSDSGLPKSLRDIYKISNANRALARQKRKVNELTSTSQLSGHEEPEQRNPPKRQHVGKPKSNTHSPTLPPLSDAHFFMQQLGWTAQPQSKDKNNKSSSAVTAVQPPAAFDYANASQKLASLAAAGLAAKQCRSIAVDISNCSFCRCKEQRHRQSKSNASHQQGSKSNNGRIIEHNTRGRLPHISAALRCAELVAKIGSRLQTRLSCHA